MVLSGLIIGFLTGYFGSDHPIEFQKLFDLYRVNHFISGGFRDCVYLPHLIAPVLSDDGGGRR